MTSRAPVPILALCQIGTRATLSSTEELSSGRTHHAPASNENGTAPRQPFSRNSPRSSQMARGQRPHHNRKRASSRSKHAGRPARHEDLPERGKPHVVHQSSVRVNLPRTRSRYSPKRRTGAWSSRRVADPQRNVLGCELSVEETSAELLQLEHAIRTGGIDQRILTDFRDAVDHVRKTAWAVQEWQERQITRHDPQTLLPLLVGERVRRAAQLGNSIVSDLTNHEVTRETPGVGQLFDAVQRMQQLLADLLRDS